jgi:predicted TIM-barrel fold metal-dependent hydrolase
VSHWLVDTGHRADELLTPAELAAASGGSAHEVVRLETLAEELVATGTPPTGYAAAFRSLLAQRARGAVAVKSVLAYRAGFDVDLSRPSDAEVARQAAAWTRDVARTGSARLTDPRLIAFGLHEAVELRLPLQLHVGLGDRDMDLRRSDPLLLTDFLRQPEVRDTPVLLLHCYPFERQAGYLAQAFRNVYLDVGLSVSFVGARSTSLVARSLALAPFDKVLYSSDACGPADLHLLGAHLWRRAIARVVGGFVAADEWSSADARRVVRMVARDNALRAYPALSQSTG